MAAASDTLKRVFLELGGKSAVIVLDDADFDTAAMIAAFTHGHPRRSGLRADLAAAGARISTTTRSSNWSRRNFSHVRYGDPNDPKTYMGPLISEQQRDKVDGMVQRAVAAGATLVTGGEKKGPGLLLYADPADRRRPRQRDRPGRGLRPGARRHRLRRRRRRGAHRQQLDLRPVRRGLRRRGPRAGRWRGGSAPARSRINGGNYFSPDAPFGGYKQSGIGREMGVAGLEEFLERKTFATVVARRQAMSGPLEGIRVLEVAMYGFVPSAGAVLRRVGRRRHQGRARRHRRPAARAAPDRAAAGRG